MVKLLHGHILKINKGSDFVMNEHIEVGQNIPGIIQRFRKNNPTVKFDNSYICEVVDENGNVIDTKIGINLVTNYGLQQLWGVTTYSSSDVYMYLGSGMDTPSPSDKTLTSYISALGGGTIVSTQLTSYPSRYDKDAHIFSVDTMVEQSSWDYIAGDNQEYDIYEIGLGLNSTSLFTHALIYDESGNQTFVKKKPNTKLYISLVWTSSINTKLIQQRYDEGKYMYINPRVLNRSRSRDYASVIMIPITQGYTVTTNNGTLTYQGYYKNDYNGIVQDDSRSTILTDDISESQSYIWTDRYQYCSGFVVSNNRLNGIDDYLTGSGQNRLKSIGTFGILSYDKISESEEIESYYVFTDDIRQLLGNITDITKNDSIYTLTDIFGSHQQYKMEDGTAWQYNDGLPCMDYNITEINMYNYLTKKYDIQVPFNSSDWDYNRMHWRLYLSLYTHYLGTNRTVYIFINPFTDRTITKFNNTSMTICATDEYWDPDTYVQITNISNIPTELSNKRYYIITAGTVAELSPEYLNPNYHKIIPAKKVFDFTDTNHCVPIVKGRPADSILNIDRSCYYRGSFKPICDNGKKWYVNSDYVVFYDSETDTCVTKSIMYDDDNNKRCCKHRRYKTTNGDRLVCFESSMGSYDALNVKNNIRIFTITDKDTDLTYQDMMLTFEDQTGLSSKSDCHHLSWSENGFLVAQRPLISQPHEAVIVDIYGNEESHNLAYQYLLKNVFGCTAILLTDNCFYMDTEESSGTKYVFKLYDMKNKVILKSYEVDDGVDYDIKFTYGFREFVYVTVYNNSTTSTIFFNTSTDTIEHLVSYIPNMNYDSWYSSCNYTAINECMVLCGTNMSSRIIRADKPNPPDSFESIFSDTVNSIVRFGYYPCIGTCHDGKQLILSYTSREHLSVVDLGLVLDNGPIQHHPYLHHDGKYPLSSRDYRTYYDSCACVFNDGIVWSCDALTTSSDYNTNGRQYYIPIECLLPLHMKGTTHTLTAYNQPVKWWGKSFSFEVTNDIDRIINGSYQTSSESDT